MWDIKGDMYKKKNVKVFDRRALESLYGTVQDKDMEEVLSVK